MQTPSNRREGTNLRPTPHVDERGLMRSQVAHE